jgi:hypothetical protein
VPVVLLHKPDSADMSCVACLHGLIAQLVRVWLITVRSAVQARVGPHSLLVDYDI